MGLDNDDWVRLKFYEHYGDHTHSNDKFMSYMRFFVYRGDLSALTPYIKPEVVDAKTCVNAQRKFFCPPLSVDNEKSALQHILHVAEERLAKYPCSYESDVKVLAENKTLTFNERNAIVLRSGEMKILKDMIAATKLGLELLDGTATKAQERVDAYKEGELPCAPYFKESLLPFLHHISK